MDLDGPLLFQYTYKHDVVVLDEPTSLPGGRIVTSDPTRSTDRAGARGDRRSFLVKAAVLPALAMGASMVPMGELLAGAAEGDDVSPELEFLLFMTSVEKAMAELYTAAISTRKLDSDGIALATSYQGHHTQHASALAELITAAGGTVPEAGNDGLVTTYRPQIQSAPDGPAVAGIFAELENALAATHLAGFGEFTSDAIAGTVGSILPIEAQHALAWESVQDPASLDNPGAQPVLQTVTGALDAEQYVASPPTTAAPQTTVAEEAGS